MTKDEIKTLIAEKIEGQGNQVDIGNALATVLNEVVDSVPENPVSASLRIPAGFFGESGTVEISAEYAAKVMSAFELRYGVLGYGYAKDFATTVEAQAAEDSLVDKLDIEGQIFSPIIVRTFGYIQYVAESQAVVGIESASALVLISAYRQNQSERTYFLLHYEV